jgi:uroporphyrinogen decarboxylase
MQNSLFLRACRGEPIPRHPVWMMRQAGRYLPEYRAIRAKVDFLTLCKTPALAAEVTVQPVDLLGVDAAVIFSDILVLLEAMGLPVQFGKDHGPRIEKTVRSTEDVEALHNAEVSRDLKYVGEAIRLAHQKLVDRNIPIVGFAGAPFTLACYAIEGKTSRDFHVTKRLLHEHPKVFTALMKKISEGVAQHLLFQIESGAAAVQIFDTWAGILSREDYRTFILPFMKSITETLPNTEVPIILYVNGSTPHLEAMAESGATVLSVDWRTPLSEVRKRVGPHLCLQGNLDPTMLYSSPSVIRKKTEAMLRDHNSPKLVANLGHGMLPDIPVDHAKTFIQTIQRYKI